MMTTTYVIRNERHFPTWEERQRQREQAVIDELLKESAVYRLVYKHWGADGLRQWVYMSDRDKEKAMLFVENIEEEDAYDKDIRQMQEDLRWQGV